MESPDDIMMESETEKEEEEAADSPTVNTSEFAEDPIILLIVGEQKIKFYAHKKKLVQSSDFFRTRLRSGMKQQICLPEESQDAIDLLMTWIYHRSVPSPENSDKDNYELAKTLMKAWLVAEKFFMPDWQNKLIDSISNYFEDDCISPSLMAWVMENCRKETAVYKFTKDRFAENSAIDSGLYREEYDDECYVWREELENLVKMEAFSIYDFLWPALDERGPPRDEVITKPVCKYHVHDDGESCEPS